jgi:copper(I)-binding protein
MKKSIALVFTLLATLSLIAAQCGTVAPSPAEQTQASNTPDVQVMEPFARASVPNGVIYMTLMNEGSADDVLLSAETDAAEAAELHESKMDDKGVMRMKPLDRLDLPAGEAAVLAPGGKHLMLIGMKEGVAVGDEISLTLTFEKSDSRTIEVEVTEGGTAMDKMKNK